MKITKIELQNVKGRSAKYALGTCNLVLARNFEGKTAIMDAVRCVLLGETPSCIDGGRIAGKSGFAAFASDFPMAMRVTVDSTEHALTLTKKGRALTLTHEKPEWMDERTRLLLDPDLYFAASGPEKIKLLTRCLGSAEIPDDEIAAKFSAIEMPEASIAPAILEQFITGIRKEIAAHQLLSAKIGAAQDFCAGLKNEAAAAQKRMLQTAQGLTDLSVVDRNIAELPTLELADARLRELRHHVQSLRDRRAALSNALTQRTSDEASAQSLEKLLGEDLTLKQTQLTNGLAAMESGIEAGTQDVQAKRAAQSKIEAAVQKLKDDAQAIVERQQIAAAERTDGADWMMGDPPSSLPLGTEFEGTARFVTAKPSHGNGTLEVVAMQRWRKLPRAQTPAELEADTDATNQIESLAMQENELNMELDAAKASVKESAAMLVQAEQQREQLRIQFQQVQRAIASQKDATKQLDALKKALTTPPVPPESVDPDIAGAEGEIAKLDDARTQVVSLLQDRKRVTEAQAEVTRVAVEIEVLNALVKVAKEISAKSAGEGIESAMETANLFCEGVLKTPLTYQDGSIGRMDRGLMVDASTFSGAEAALCRMALTTALATKAKIKLVLLDELSIFDLEYKERLVSNLAGLVERGIIDQFIVADNDVEFWKGTKTVTIIKP